MEEAYLSFVRGGQIPGVHPSPATVEFSMAHYRGPGVRRMGLRTVVTVRGDLLPFCRSIPYQVMAGRA